MIGAIFGIVFKSDVAVVKPLRDLFLNLLLISIVPLIFFSISSSIAKMKERRGLSKILIICYFSNYIGDFCCFWIWCCQVC